MYMHKNGAPLVVRMRATNEDRRVLPVAASQLPVEERPEEDYSNRVVNKPWGFEYLLFSNSSVSAWVLFLKPDHSTSMHCHRMKTTSLVVLDGTVRFATLNSSHLRGPGEAVQLGNEVFHRTSALSTSGAYVLEVESPRLKHDLVRLKDSYGRVGSGYEGPENFVACSATQTTLELSRSASGECVRSFGRTAVRIVQPSDPLKVLTQEVGAEDVICILDGGGTRRADGQLLLGPGECQSAGDLQRTEHKWLVPTALAIVSADC